MQRLSTDEIRQATFTTSMLGYDRQEVEAFLAQLAEEIESLDMVEEPTEQVRRRFERAGERAATVLSAAEKEAEQAIADAERSAGELRADAEAQAQVTVAQAEAEAADILARAERRREEVESQIMRLHDRRAMAIEQLAELATEISEVADAGRLRAREQREVELAAAEDPASPADEDEQPLTEESAAEESAAGQPLAEQLDGEEEPSGEHAASAPDGDDAPLASPEQQLETSESERIERFGQRLDAFEQDLGVSGSGPDDFGGRGGDDADFEDDSTELPAPVDERYAAASEDTHEMASAEPEVDEDTR